MAQTNQNNQNIVRANIALTFIRWDEYLIYYQGEEITEILEELTEEEELFLDNLDKFWEEVRKEMGNIVSQNELVLNLAQFNLWVEWCQIDAEMHWAPCPCVDDNVITWEEEEEIIEIE